MTSNRSNLNTLPIYKLYFDDIEEIFLNTVSFKYLFISTIITSLLTIASLMILFYRSKTIFLACFIPFIYSLVFYDFIQLLSIILLKYTLMNINEKYFSELCRWPYYLKTSSEAGQCLTLIFIYGLRCQKVQFFLKHNRLPNSGRIHSRALTFVCLLFIVYVNNWITHLKVEKVHLITLNESNHEINIQEYPRTLYGINEMKLNHQSRFYSDLDKYARHYEITRIKQTKPEKNIHTQSYDTVNEIIIKFPYSNLFGERKPITHNRTRRKFNKSRAIVNKTISGNNSYHIHRCTYEQKNFFLANFLSLIHSIFYFLFIIYYLTKMCRYKIPYITMDHLQTLHDKAFSIGRRKSADRHKQLMLLAHLRRFQYLLVYCHTILILIRLMYICLLTVTVCLFQSPFKWFTMKIFFHVLFCIVYYSIPLRIIFLFLYLFFSLFFPHINSIFYYIFRTKLHFSCQLQKPTIRFRLHIVQYDQREANHNQPSINSLIFDVPSSGYDEHSTMYPNESIAVCEENSSGQNVVTTNSFAIVNESQQSKL